MSGQVFTCCRFHKPIFMLERLRGGTETARGVGMGERPWSAMTIEPRFLFRVRLGPEHAPTGRTVHRHGDSAIPAPVLLKIVQYEADSGYYLFYCDAEGEVLTDTYHDTVELAMGQAEWEFSVTRDQWEALRS